MGFEKHTGQDTEALLKEFDVTLDTGLSTRQVSKLQQAFGRNDISKNEINWKQVLTRQFKSAFIYLLLAASVIAFLLGERLDSFFILFFVFINVLLGFFQEYKSEQTARFLKKYTNKRATVIRDGIEATIDATGLVRGDIVLIETGDIVPADLRLVTANALILNESALTGESAEIAKNTDPLNSGTNDVFRAANTAFSGTTVTEGKGLGVVVATGKDTQFGKIAKMATTAVGTSAFEKQINKFSKFILFMTLTTLIAVYVVHIFFKNTLSVSELTLFSIALAVGVIPEAMPLVTTFSLSLGASKLAKKKVIVKRLSAIEDLGGIQILCTDKTGTITENKLKIAEIRSDNPDKLLNLGLTAASSFDTKGMPNNSFDLAMINRVGPLHKTPLKETGRIFEIPFNPNRRRNSVLTILDSHKQLIVRGAPESIIPYVSELSETDRQTLEWIKSEGKKGRRILAIAKKDFQANSYTVKDEEEGLELVGLISFEDTIKSTTHEAIRKAKQLGVRTIMVTGDNPDVAVSVGIEAGIARKADDVITGEEFNSLSRAKQKEVSKNINVFARMSPEQKFNLVKLLQEDSEVGYLGEGINDAPALKAAGVSLVVDDASDVSREVADIILLKHDLKVIIDGIELGRKTFVNVTNYIKATLASNFGNFYAMVFVTLVIDFLPMLPVQILLVNLLSDFPMISIATDNVDKKDIVNPKSYAMKELILMATVLGLVSTAFDFIFFGIFKNYGAGSLQTYWFIGSILTELVLIYSIRTKGWFFAVKNLPSRTIFVLTIAAGFVTVLIPFTSFGVEIFKFIIPSAGKLTLVFGIVAGYLVSTEIVKRVYFKYIETS